MKLTSVLLAAMAACTSASHRSSDDIPSSNFRLVLKSDNSTLNGTVLGACHQGAAIEGLCITDKKESDPVGRSSIFHLNITSSPFASLPPATNPNSPDLPGTLVYELHYLDNQTVSSGMHISYYPHTPVALPTFSPGPGEPIIRFTPCGEMYIAQTSTDEVSPPVHLEAARKRENWWVCLTRTNYTYWTLVWVVGRVGSGEEAGKEGEGVQNPSCRKVRVVRVWA